MAETDKLLLIPFAGTVLCYRRSQLALEQWRKIRFALFVTACTRGERELFGDASSGSFALYAMAKKSLLGSFPPVSQPQSSLPTDEKITSKCFRFDGWVSERRRGMDLLVTLPVWLLYLDHW